MNLASLTLMLLASPMNVFVSNALIVASLCRDVGGQMFMSFVSSSTIAL